MSSAVPEGWQVSSIEDLLTPNCLFSDGDWVESKDQDPAGTNRLLQLGDIGDGRFLNKSNRFMNDEQFTRLDCTQLKEGDILIARMPEPIGRACILPRLENRLATVVDIAVLRSSEVDSYWLMSVINSAGFRTKIEEQSSGTTRTRIGRTALSRIKLLSPPLPEQKKIASILTSVDEVIENTQKQIEKLQDLKKATMNEFLTKGFGHTEFKDSELGRIPKSWEVANLGSFVLDQKSGASLSPSDFCEDGFGVIPKKAVQFGGRIVLGDELTFCTNEFADNNRNNLVGNEYVIAVLRDLVPSGPSIGLIGMIMEDDEFILAQGVYGYLLDSRLNPLFLSLISNTDWYRGIMRKIFVGSTQIHIRSTEFLEVVIPIPPIDEQNNIAERINTIESQILLKKEIKHKYSSLKKSLMQDLLTGTVRVTVN